MQRQNFLQIIRVGILIDKFSTILGSINYCIQIFTSQFIHMIVYALWCIRSIRISIYSCVTWQTDPTRSHLRPRQSGGGDRGDDGGGVASWWARRHARWSPPHPEALPRTTSCSCSPTCPAAPSPCSCPSQWSTPWVGLPSPPENPTLAGTSAQGPRRIQSPPTWSCGCREIHGDAHAFPSLDSCNISDHKWALTEWFMWEKQLVRVLIKWW